MLKWRLKLTLATRPRGPRRRGGGGVCVRVRVDVVMRVPWKVCFDHSHSSPLCQHTHKCSCVPTHAYTQQLHTHVCMQRLTCTYTRRSDTPFDQYAHVISGTLHLFL